MPPFKHKVPHGFVPFLLLFFTLIFKKFCKSLANSNIFRYFATEWRLAVPSLRCLGIVAYW